MKFSISFFITLIFLGTVSFAASPAPLTLAVLPGDGLREIATHLKNEGLIFSSIWFQFLALLTGQADDLKPGVYVFENPPGALRALRAIARGPEATRVTIFEGETTREIATRLADAGVVFDTAAFIEAALPYEGYLFPDTYEFSQGSSSDKVLQIFIDHFKKKLTSILPRLLLKGLGPDNKELHELVILASLLEKEIPKSDERPTVAGIFKRRLRLEMPLQVDATVVYAVCNGVFKGCPRLTRSDYSIHSPYNTYERVGLPVGPIGNPGLDALEAILKPRSSSYLYYLSDPKTGRTIFSETLDEHNENRARYLGL